MAMRLSIGTILLLVTISWLAACASPMNRGIRTYHAGAHPRALAQLREAEAGMIDTSPRRRAKYTLYRGLTHLSLGDRESAEHWLAEAKTWMDRDRTLLSPADRGRLLAAWDALGHAPGTWGATVRARR